MTTQYHIYRGIENRMKGNILPWQHITISIVEQSIKLKATYYHGNISPSLLWNRVSNERQHITMATYHHLYRGIEYRMKGNILPWQHIAISLSLSWNRVSNKRQHITMTTYHHLYRGIEYQMKGNILPWQHITISIVEQSIK